MTFQISIFLILCKVLCYFYQLYPITCKQKMRNKDIVIKISDQDYYVLVILNGEVIEWAELAGIELTKN